MNLNPSPVYLSAIDEERFGFPVARANNVTQEKLPGIMKFCGENGVVLLIARCLASELRAAQLIEDHGFQLMDTLVYYARNLKNPPIPEDGGEITVRSMRGGEEELVKFIAADAFRGYLGHYHADRRLDSHKSDEAYTSWAYRCCVSKEVADQVLVAEYQGDILGFVCLRLNTSEEGEAFLFGVHPNAQRRGICRSFLIHGMKWILLQGATRMVESTQITNVVVQKVWTRLGFEPSHAYYTFHKWFDSR